MKQNGFTMIELMVSVAILAILVTLAAPSFTEMLQNNRLSTQANGMLGMFQYARSEAVSRSRSVSICPSANGTSCTGTTAWESGWIMWEDADNDSVLDTTESIIRFGSAFDGGNFVKTSDKVVRFSPAGIISALVDMSICDSRGASHAKGVIINLTGRVKLSDTNSSGGSLSCS